MNDKYVIIIDTKGCWDILANCLKDIECGETGRCKARLRMYAIMPNAPEEEGKDEN